MLYREVNVQVKYFTHYITMNLLDVDHEARQAQGQETKRAKANSNTLNLPFLDIHSHEHHLSLWHLFPIHSGDATQGIRATADETEEPTADKVEHLGDTQLGKGSVEAMMMMEKMIRTVRCPYS